jgi:hypothetical protein
MQANDPLFMYQLATHDPECDEDSCADGPQEMAVVYLTAKDAGLIALVAAVAREVTAGDGGAGAHMAAQVEDFFLDLNEELLS